MVSPPLFCRAQASHGEWRGAAGGYGDHHVISADLISPHQRDGVVNLVLRTFHSSDQGFAGEEMLVSNRINAIR
jgi:hypothetical protein